MQLIVISLLREKNQNITIPGDCFVNSSKEFKSLLEIERKKVIDEKSPLFEKFRVSPVFIPLELKEIMHSLMDKKKMTEVELFEASNRLKAFKKENPLFLRDFAINIDFVEMFLALKLKQKPWLFRLNYKLLSYSKERFASEFFRNELMDKFLNTLLNELKNEKGNSDNRNISFFTKLLERALKSGALEVPHKELAVNEIRELQSSSLAFRSQTFYYYLMESRIEKKEIEGHLLKFKNSPVSIQSLDLLQILLKYFPRNPKIINDTIKKIKESNPQRIEDLSPFESFVVISNIENISFQTRLRNEIRFFNKASFKLKREIYRFWLRHPTLRSIGLYKLNELGDGDIKNLWQTINLKESL